MSAIMSWMRALLFGAHLFRHRFSHSFSLRESEQTTYEKFIEKRRKQKRLYHRRKYKPRVQYLQKYYKFKSSQARDHRFSNQRTLRRMFRNN